MKLEGAKNMSASVAKAVVAAVRTYPATKPASVAPARSAKGRKRKAKRKPKEPPVGVLEAHHDVVIRAVDSDSLKTGLKVRTRYEGLRTDGLIDVPQLLACDRFHKDWHIAEGVSAGGGDVTGRVDYSSLPGANDCQLDAGMRRKAALAAVAPAQAWLLIRVVIMDWSWRQIGVAALVNHETAKAQAVKAIVALEGHYTAVDNARGRRTPSPATPFPAPASQDLALPR